MILHAPTYFYTVLIYLDAIDPKGVELAYLDVRASSASEARSIVEMFVRSNVKIIGIHRHKPLVADEIKD